jgi:hypothetical protein
MRMQGFGKAKNVNSLSSVYAEVVTGLQASIFSLHRI